MKTVVGLAILLFSMFLGMVLLMSVGPARKLAGLPAPADGSVPGFIAKQTGQATS